MLTLLKLRFLLLFIVFISPNAGQSALPAFSISISASRDAVARGAEVKIKIILKNTSDHKITIAKSIGEDQGEFHYSIFVRDGHGNLAPKINRTTSTKEGQGDVDPIVEATEETMLLFPLKPGEVLKDGVIVSKAYDMTKPGRYTIQVERKDDESTTIVKSNTVTVTVASR